MAQSYHKQIKPFKRAFNLVESFHAADSDHDGSINAQELDQVRGLPLSKVAIIKAELRRDGELSISKLLDLCSERLEVGDEFGKALKSALIHMNLKKDAPFKGEELCEAIAKEGIQLTPSDTEEIVASINNFGTRAISFQDLEFVVNALV